MFACVCIYGSFLPLSMIHVYLDPIDAFGRVLRALRDAPLEPHVEAVEAILEEIVIFFVSKN